MRYNNKCKANTNNHAKEISKMKYTAFLKLYDLKDTPETREDWLASEWSKGRLYLQDGEYYCTETGKKVN